MSQCGRRASRLAVVTVLVGGTLTLPVLRPVAAQLAPVLGNQQGAPTVRWQVVEGRHVRVITPAELAREAQRLATLVDRVAESDTTTLAGKPPRIDIVLRHQYAQSNAFVTLAPRRAEFFLQAPQAEGLLGSGDWLTLLAVHEYRHVKQFSSARRGFTAKVSAIFGEPAWATLSAWSIPSWFWEGDAVATETALTASGRGRLPLFDADFRAQLLRRPVPGYHTVLTGSFRDAVPNQYVHGYHLISAAREQFGADIWDRALLSSSKRSFVPMALSGALKRTTGLRARALHDRTMAALQDSVRAAAASSTITPVTNVSPEPRDWTHDLTPQWESNNSLIATRYGLADRPELVRHAGGTVTPLHWLGPITGAPHSVGGDAVAWVEERPDPRYGFRSFNVLMVRDLRTGTVTQLGDTTRWSAVGLAPDGQRLVTIEQHPAGGTSLVLQSRTGAVLRRDSVPEGDQLISPRFSREGSALLMVRLRRGAGRRVERCPVAGGDCTPLTPWSTTAISAPSGNDTLVVAYAPVQGRDQIVAWRASTGEWAQVTERPVGAIDPVVSPDGRRLAFTDHTASGRRIATMPLTPATWRPFTFIAPDPARVTLLTAQAAATGLERTVTDTTLPVRDYAAWRHLWNPVGLTVSLPSLGTDLGVTLSSRNVLGTAAIDVGARYNQQEQSWGGRLGVTYAARFPIVSAWVDQATRRDQFPAAKSATSTYAAGEWTWREQSIGTGVLIPLDFTRTAYTTRLTLQGTVEERLVTGSTLPDWFGPDEGSVRPVTLSITGERTFQWVRDILPVQGQTASLMLRTTPIGGTFQGSQAYGRVQQFLPGIGANPALRLDAGADWQALRSSVSAPRPYRFTTALPFARGYEAVTLPRLNRVSVDYVAPLWYIDRSLLSRVQLVRLRSGVFGDWTTGSTQTFPGGVPVIETNRYRSAGVELWLDAAWIHPSLVIPMGVRWSWRFDGPARNGVAQFVIGTM